MTGKHSPTTRCHPSPRPIHIRRRYKEGHGWGAAAPFQQFVNVLMMFDHVQLTVRAEISATALAFQNQSSFAVQGGSADPVDRIRRRETGPPKQTASFE
jgi:hypothetical protein